MSACTLSSRGLAALVACGLVSACSNGGPGEPVEEPAHIRTSASFLGLTDALTQWWAEPGKERVFVFDIVNTGRTAEHVPMTVTPGPNLRVLSLECVNMNNSQSCLGANPGANAWTMASIGRNDLVRVLVRAIEQNPQSYRAQMRLAADLPGDPRPWENSALHDRPVYLADRSVAVEAPATAAAGTDIQVRLLLSNQGPDSFYEPRRPDLPDGVTAEAIDCVMTDGGICITGTLDASDVGVRAGQTAVLRYRVRVPADYRGALTVSKALRGEGDVHPGDNISAVTVQVGPPGSP
jgi:hypothetical protein